MEQEHFVAKTAVSPPAAPVETLRRWPVRFTSVLLLLQALGIIYLVGYYFSIIDPSRDMPPLEELVGYTFTMLPKLVQDSLIISILFTPLVLLTVASAIGFIFLWRGGWVLTMLCQGVILFISLAIFINRPVVVMWPIHILMAYSIFLVLYLNSSGVQLVFQKDGLVH
ncbi:MAG: hypothetical protein H6641_14635 [Caldilineaceae bacterium]|nr:hypothetical protein [Caldilineaceae bacterium]